MLLYNVNSPPDLICINVTIIDDTYLESEEYFYLQLDSPDPDVKFKIDHSIVQIVDDDCEWVITCQADSIKFVCMCLCG